MFNRFLFLGALASTLLTISANSQEVIIGIASNFSEISQSSSNPYGDYFRKGIQLALKDSRQKLQKKNIRIIIKEFDYGVNQLHVIDAAKNANDSDIVALLGYNWSSQALIAAPIHQKAGLPFITPSATADRLGTLGKYVHLGAFNNSFMGKTLAHVSRSILHAKKAAIVVAEDCPYCHDLAQAFEKEFELSGGTIKIKIGVLESQRKFDDVVKLLKKEDVDVILIPNYELTSIRIISALIDSGIDKPFLGGDGWGDVGEEFFKELHGRKISSYSVSHWNPDLKTPTSLAFKKSFISEFGKSPNDTAVLAYDSMMMLIQAILNLKNYSRDAVELELNKLHIFRGVTGTFKITPNNAPLKTIVLLKTNNNRFDVVTTIEPN